MDLTATEVLRRMAEGDIQSVIRGIADPIERWEAERELAQCQTVDEIHQDCGVYSEEDLDEALQEGREGVLEVAERLDPMFAMRLREALSGQRRKAS